MKRRQALRVLASAAPIPLIPAPALAELLTFGHRARACAGPDASRDPWSPRTLGPDQEETVAAIADVILPETDTPGATGARVNEFVDLILTDWFSEDERDHFLDGIEEVDALTRRRFDRPFVECSPEQKIATVAALDDQVEVLRRSEGEGDDPSDHFFYQMKRLTLTGFFTSEVGMDLLGYEIVPGTFEGCVLADEFAPGGGS